jgi:hypothetical protein
VEDYLRRVADVADFLADAWRRSRPWRSCARQFVSLFSCVLSRPTDRARARGNDFALSAVEIPRRVAGSLAIRFRQTVSFLPLGHLKLALDRVEIPHFARMSVAFSSSTAKTQPLCTLHRSSV